MPLKRITFSGRLGARESAEVWKTVARGVVCMVLDIVITLAISIALFYMFAGWVSTCMKFHFYALLVLESQWKITATLFRYAISPYERPVPCNDDSIKQPFKQNTVRMKHLLVVALGTPFFIICFVEALVYRHSEVVLSSFVQSTSLNPLFANEIFVLIRGLTSLRTIS